MIQFFKIYTVALRILLFILSVSAFAGCLEPHHRTDLDTTSSGTINISVDESFKPVIDAEIKVFESLYPKAKIIAHYKPEAECLKDFVSDSATRMVIVTRGLTDDEEKYFKDSLKYYPSYDKVANDAIAVVVNKNSPDSFITMNKIRALLEGSSGDKEKVVMDGLKETSTLRFAVDSILKGKPFDLNKILGVKNSLAVIDYVESDKNVIGLVGVSWVGDKSDSSQLNFLKKVKVASVNCNACGDDDIFVKPYQYNIMFRRYPMVRGLYYIIKENYDGLGSGFANFMSQEKGQLIFWHSYLGTTKMNFSLREASSK